MNKENEYSCPLLFLKMGFCPLFSGFVHFLPTFVFEKMVKNGKKVAICPLFAHFLKQKWPQKSEHSCGFAGFLPTYPLFFSIKCEKKFLIFIIIWQKKWANGLLYIFMQKWISSRAFCGLVLDLYGRR